MPQNAQMARDERVRYHKRMKITFHGGSREVTGACYLLETGATKLLIDCGLFQGAKAFEELNFKDFAFAPAEIDALFVTHGHLDHVGRIPKLVREGFKGKIYSTASTRDLARLILEDAFSLASREEKALYEMADLERTFAQWHTFPYGESGRVGDAEFTLHNAGHILGSSFIEIKSQGKKILFTGDLGNIPSVLLRPPASVRGVDYLIIESTYGMRAHEPESERTLKLERAVEDAASRRGTLLIPAFATERTQDILHLLNEMVHLKRIPDVPVFVDAPLAIRITEVFEKHYEEYREEIRELLRQHPHLFRFKRLRMTQSVEESKAINYVVPPKVIIAGSGMMNGGRILHHARRYLQDAKSILLITGYQAGGSLGRRLIDGETQVKIFGEDVYVEAEIRKINGFSAHADNPQLFSFVQDMHEDLTKVFVVQGEEAQALHFMNEIRDRLGIDAVAPMLLESFEL